MTPLNINQGEPSKKSKQHFLEKKTFGRKATAYYTLRQFSLIFSRFWVFGFLGFSTVLTLVVK